jgi:hypothetical protein
MTKLLLHICNNKTIDLTIPTGEDADTENITISNACPKCGKRIAKMAQHSLLEDTMRKGMNANAFDVFTCERFCVIPFPEAKLLAR